MGKQSMWSFSCFNPPYQVQTDDTSDNPVYDKFIEAATTIADKVEVITPARFLFKVLDYEANSKNVFPNTDIKGGVAISYYDKDKEFEPIELYTPYPEMHAVYLKSKDDVEKNGNLSDIMILQNKYNLDVLYADHPDYKRR